MEESPVYSLHKLTYALDRAGDRLLQANFGISQNRALVLVAVLDKDDITQHQIASMLGRTDAAVSALLVALVKDGYVTTRVSPDHKRKNIVILTAKGETLAREVSIYLNDRFASLAKAAGVDPVSYRELTEKLIDALAAVKKK